MRIGIIVIGLAISLAACQQATGPIDPQDSMLRVELGPGDWPTITRDLVEVQEFREEVWAWPSGALRLIHARRMSFYRNDYADPEDLAGIVGYWPTFVRTDIPLGSVRSGENANGRYQYATAEKRDRICFFMLQPIPVVRPPNTMPVGPDEISDGFFSFYHCAARSLMSPADMEAEGLKLANALVRNW